MHLSEPVVVRRILHPEFAVYGCPLQVPPRRLRRIVLDNYTWFADEIGEMEFPIVCSPEAHPVIKETGGVRKARWRERALEKAASG